MSLFLLLILVFLFQISDAKTSVEARYEAFAASPFKELEEVN